MIETLAILVLFAGLNRLRGSGRGRPLFSKGVTSALCGGLIAWHAYRAGVPLPQVAYAGAVTGLGVWLGVLLGWGKYFAAFHGRYDAAHQEFRPADTLANHVFAKTHDGHLAGIAGFTVRAVLFYPAFLALIWLNPWAALIGLGVLAQGLIYGAMRWVPEKIALPLAELAYGAWLGFLFTLAV